MTLVVPNEGELKMLNDLLGTTLSGAQELRLYSNNYDAIAGSVLADFTEVVTGGYAAMALTRAGWSAAAVVGGIGSKSYGTPQVTTFTATRTVVGYMVVDVTSGKVLFAERLFAGAGQSFNNGDTLTITPKLTLT